MLRCGFFTTWQRWRHYMGEDRIGMVTPKPIADHISEFRAIRAVDTPGPVNDAILVDGRYWPARAFVQLVRNLPLGGAVCEGDKLVAVAPDNAEAWLRDGRGHRWERARVDASLITELHGETDRFTHLWEMVDANGRMIEEDFRLLSNEWPTALDGEEREGVFMYAADQILVSETAQIDAGVTLDARTGPILIGENVHIQSHTRVEGPAAICNGVLLCGGKIRGGTTIGPHCRVGGEIEQSIFQAYSNKYHDGFIGHAYIGEWVNLGAGTTNSDLKNNYGNVRVEFPLGMVETGLNKVGCFLGDHVKTGIGTLLNTGTVVGFATNVFGGGMPHQKHIPSFMWGGQQGFEEFHLEKAKEVAAAAMPRRNVEFSPAVAAMFDFIFDQTRKHRQGDASDREPARRPFSVQS